MACWLEVARHRPDRAGVFVDFDGTLAAIVDDPAAARPVPGAVPVLASLSARWGVVAVVSGRPAAFLAEHLEGAGQTRFLGLYGLEQAMAGRRGVTVHPAAESWRRAVERTSDDADTAKPAGVAVERKGLTVTLHYRAVPGQAAAVGRLADELGRRHGLRAHDGKMSVELRPPVDVDKGTVVRELSSGLAAAAFAGDDIGDLPAFAALAARRSAGTATLAIAAGGPETPAAVVEAADVTVDGPGGVVAALRRLADG